MSLQDYIDAQAAELLDGVLDSPLQALFLPTFHLAVRLTLVEDWVDVAIVHPDNSLEGVSRYLEDTIP